MWDRIQHIALVEAKSTDREASQKMIQAVQQHVMRYTREEKQDIPPALLIVNHSCKNPPSRRNLFYEAKDVQDGLKEGGITAVDSVFLHSLCQDVLADKSSKEEARAVLKAGHVVLV